MQKLTIEKKLKQLMSEMTKDEFTTWTEAELDALDVFNHVT